jgi:hypothetical protein
MIWCISCKQNLSEDRFLLRKDSRSNWKSRRMSWCKRCTSKNAHLSSKYGITLKQFNEMLTTQDSKCKIYHRPFVDGIRLPSVDHCHVTKKVRGLLCQRCNILVIPAIEILERTIKYKRGEL